VLLPLSCPASHRHRCRRAVARFPWDVYDTIWLIVIGFVGRFTGYAVRTISGSWCRLHPELEESARICGLGPVRALCASTLAAGSTEHHFELDSCSTASSCRELSMVLML